MRCDAMAYYGLIPAGVNTRVLQFTTLSLRLLPLCVLAAASAAVMHLCQLRLGHQLLIATQPSTGNASATTATAPFAAVTAAAIARVTAMVEYEWAKAVYVCVENLGQRSESEDLPHCGVRRLNAQQIFLCKTEHR